MAIFYNHIKGCGKYATNTFSGTFPEGASEHKDVWSFIKFADILYVDKSDDTKLLTSIKNSPIIYLNAPNQPVKNITNECYSQDYKAPEQEADKLFTESNTFCLGHILTTNATDQYIKKKFYFEGNVQMKDSLAVTQTLTINNEWSETDHATAEGKRTIELSGRTASVIGVDDKHNVAFTNQATLYFFDQPCGETTVNPNTWEKNYGAIYRGTDYFYIESTNAARDGHLPGYFAFSEIKIINHDNQNDATLLVEGKCEALYFNATSDRRAKTNITPAEFSALHIVNSIPTYTFNYNNKEEKTIGLIAQEAAEFDLDGFNMVDNLEATGQDGDFMQMKESKLVYVLWKAVQELSVEVEDLKAQIRNLK